MKANIEVWLLLLLMIAVVISAVPTVKAHWPNEFEQFGPHVDQVLIKLYSSESAEFAAFQNGEIDLIDWPLTGYWINQWQNNPEINMMDYGGDLGLFQFDINQNQTKPKSGPNGPVPGTHEDNIGSLVEFRHAVAHLVDRAYFISTILQGFGVPVYTMVPPALGGWLNPNVDQHPYNPPMAANILDTADIKDHDGDGYRDWPGTSNRVEIDFVVREDHTPGRKEAASLLMMELTNLGLKWTRWSAYGSVDARRWVMAGKSFTIYTGGWAVGRDPDYLFTLYHSSMYWHPGDPPNYAHVNDPVLDLYLEGIHYAQTHFDAMTNTHAAQARMADIIATVPIYTSSGIKAGRTEYTGGTDGNGVIPDDGENLYRRLPWKGFVNEFGKGLNSWWSFLDAHPEGYELPIAGTKMVLRYGFKVSDLTRLNPVYSGWYWEWEVMGKTYDSLSVVNPYDLSEDLPWIADRWNVFVWQGPNGPATELVFDLRNDIYWHDGVQLTGADVYFTFVELIQAIQSRGLPPPWWYSNLIDINSVTVVGNQVTIRLNTLNYFALHSIGNNVILPRHVWGPIMMGPDMIIGTSDDNTYDPQTFSPDENLVGSGPFKVYPHSIDPADNDYYVPSSHVTLDANRNYFRYTPNLKTGGNTQICWNMFANVADDQLVEAMTVWKLNFHRYEVHSEEYIVVKDVTGAWWWWKETGQILFVDDPVTHLRVVISWPGQWISGSAPTLPPNPPTGVTAEIDQKPSMTSTQPLLFLGNKPGLFLKLVPVEYPPGTRLIPLVKEIWILERDTSKGPNGVWEGGYPNGDDGQTYPWRKFWIDPPEPDVMVDTNHNGYSGDVNDDCVVDIRDAVLLSVNFGAPAWVRSELDCNNDARINILDCIEVVGDWTW